MTPTDINSSDGVYQFKLCIELPSDSNMFYFLIENKIGDTPIAVACRHGHLAIIKIYFHYHAHFFHDKLNFQYLLDVASLCGQFEVAYYLKSACISLDLMAEIDLAEYIGYGSQHDQDRHIYVLKFHKRWCVMDFTSHKLAITESPFCMAVLRGNYRYAQRFIMLQGNSAYRSTEFSPCHAACISDDIHMLNTLFNN